ncbi:MAG: DUF3313 family protein [Planctomycetota bacterium]
MKAISRHCAATGAAFLLLCATDLSAEDSGFLSDYSKLKPVAGTDIRMYTAPNAYTDFKNYTAVMIDQPELVIADDSKYKGIKPDDAKVVADTMRKALSDAVSKNGRVKVVDKPGPGVLYARLAASNVHLKKKSRGVLGYTPAGFVVGSAVSASQDMMAPVVDRISSEKKAKAGESWMEEHTVMAYWATRFNCRLKNSQKPESEWQDCEAQLP